MQTAWKKLTVWKHVFFLSLVGAVSAWPAPSELISPAPRSARLPKVVDWASPDGMRRLERSDHKVDFFSLASHFEAQQNQHFAGPAAGVIVLNALRAGSDRVPSAELDPEVADLVEAPKRYTQQSFFSQAASRFKTKRQVCGESSTTKPGMALKELHRMFLAHGLKSYVRVLDQGVNKEAAIAEIKHNLQESGNYVVAALSRSVLEQAAGEQISPIAAYDAQTQSFLVMDVDPHTAPWSWVEEDVLIAAMRTYDIGSDKGYLLLSE